MLFRANRESSSSSTTITVGLAPAVFVKADERSSILRLEARELIKSRGALRRRSCPSEPVLVGYSNLEFMSFSDLLQGIADSVIFLRGQPMSLLFRSGFLGCRFLFGYFAAGLSGLCQANSDRLFLAGYFLSR